MILKRNNTVVSSFTPEYVGKSIVIAIDSSKSNTGMVIGDANGNVYDDYEIDCSGTDNEVHWTSYHTRRELRNMLKGANIVAVGIEDIITKKSDNEQYGKGMQMHQSRAKITHVFDSFIIFFLDEFNIMPELVPNQSWKAAILPEEFRRRTHKKGSKDYYDLYFPNSRWAGRKDDVTDAYCIYQFILKKHKFDMTYDLAKAKLYEGRFDWGLFAQEAVALMPKTTRKFKYQEDMTLEQLANSLVSSMVTAEDYVYTFVPVTSVPIGVLYSDRMRSKFPKMTEELALVVTK